MIPARSEGCGIGDTVIQSALRPGPEPAAEDNELEISASSFELESGPLPAQHGSALSGLSGDDALTPETPHLQETFDGQVNYIDPSHWMSILEDIKEVREHLSGQVPTQPMSHHDTRFNLDHEVTDPSFLPNSVQDVSLDEILSSLPSQPICDMLLSWYFNSRYMVLGIIHPGKFQSEYAAFWESPSTTPPLWIALLFSVLSVAATLRRISNIANPEGSMPPIDALQKRAVRCLVLGRYSTANALALEAFILHLQSCFFSSSTPPTDIWFEMGTIIRLAFRMGYHRDPSNLPGISPFDGEMRRRVWLNIFQVEALMSFMMGFPSMIPTEFCDTEVPRNLDYSDLHPGMITLPPSRPLSEYTPVLYTIIKAGVMGVFKKIVAHTQSLSVPTYDKTLALDAEMRHIYSVVPDPLRQRDVNRSFLDHAGLICQRCTIELLYLKGLIVLHRRYISYDLQSPTFEPLRRACINAALDMLFRQADLHKACGPGGRLYEDRWMVFSIPAHDFLLAAMVVCLDLSIRMRSRKRTVSTDSGREYEQLAGREYRALQISQRIWATNDATSPEAHIAALALDLMIKKVADNDVGLFLEHDVPSGNADLGVDTELPYASAMSQMIDGSEGIDWGLLDQYLQNMDPSTPEVAN
ncbi:uncharacterized protein DNG_04445 [Cephalotrichum gorgonifer]|uniref:Xylanolytic transcriptional activator regulatory domain-containing protein n=1 Tax=Cephalotrichum gorgonifer TaxID=2041049 RepID=A0AAE8SV66_9PEZI|nr:uncharacterized protein DNG_04445 [Cephalotrichum gorgonifer]